MKTSLLKHALLGLLCFTALCIQSCSEKPSAQKKQPTQPSPTATACQTPVRTIEIYTLGKVHPRVLQAMQDSLRKYYPKCEFVRNLPLPDSAYYAPRHRYLARKLTDYLTRFRREDNIVVGLTEKDISLNNFRQAPNFGIMGLASGIGTRVSVCSSFRLKSNAHLFRLMQHEIGHSIGLRHCPTPGCIMQNAHGKNMFVTCHRFCPRCRKFMTEHHWKYD